MSYLTDNPWPVVIVLAGLAIVCFVLGHPMLRRIAAVMVLAAGGVYAMSEMITSPTEHVQATVSRMLDEFQAEDIDAIATLISDRSPKLVETASKGLGLVAIRDDFHVRKADVSFESDSKAKVRVRANGTILVRDHGIDQRVSELWDTVWIQEDGEWKISEAIRLNPISAKPMGTFDSY